MCRIGIIQTYLKLEGEEFNKTFRKGKTKMLEVVSVMDLKEITVKADKNHE